MFTGLVEATGRVVRTRRTAGAAVLTIDAPFAGELSVGESVSVSGACQTVVRVDGSVFDVEAVSHTLAVTTLGTLRPGDAVNLERALKLGDRLGGHLVTGHIDGVGRVAALDRGPGNVTLRVQLPEGLSRYVVARGSIAIDGVSLTVAEIEGSTVTATLIPETLRATVAGEYRTGAAVNVETDVLAKHQEKLIRSCEKPDASGGLTEKRLRELGFME